MKIWQILGGAGIALALLGGCGGNDSALEDRVAQAQKAEKEDPVEVAKRVRNVVIDYLAQPKYTHSDFLTKVTGANAKFEMINLDDRFLYFTISDSEDAWETADLLATTRDNVEWGQLNDDNKLVLGEYVWNVDDAYVMRIPIEDFKVDPDRVIEFDYKGLSKLFRKQGNLKYDISLRELRNFMDNKSIYGGMLNVDAVGNPTGENKRFANHGVMVARKGEESLTRLVSRLTKGCRTNEERAQRLLDFVTLEIEYDRHANVGGETLKRPNEVLMSQKADCSGKAILLASLLEQTDIDSFLVYTTKHITVAIAGDFPDDNGLSLKIGDKKYFIAEPAAGMISSDHVIIMRFDIGKTKPCGSKEYFAKMIGFQKPGKNAPVLNTSTGKAYPFR